MYPDPYIHPFYSTEDFLNIVRKFTETQICAYNPFLGIIPVEVSDIFPAAHNLIAQKSISSISYQAKDYPSFIESCNQFITKNNFEEIIIIANDFIYDVIASNKTLMKRPKIQIFDYKQDIISKL